jgi:hypothetical protein
MSNVAPSHLPQINAPYEIVVDRLNHYGVSNKMVEIDPQELETIQGFVFSDNIDQSDLKDAPPIYVSNNNKVIDGNHRFYKALMNKQPINSIQVDLDENSAIRMLNKIQDIYEYEEQKKMEEVVAQGVINDFNDKESGISNNEFLAMLENSGEKKESNNKMKLFAYRKGGIKENSAIGNFFILNPEQGYEKYEIEFDNILDIDQNNPNFDKSKPIDYLLGSWFPNIDFEKTSEPFSIPVNELKYMAVSEKAKNMGYDGIKYGDLMIQGLK